MIRRPALGVTMKSVIWPASCNRVWYRKSLNRLRRQNLSTAKTSTKTTSSLSPKTRIPTSKRKTSRNSRSATCATAATTAKQVMTTASRHAAPRPVQPPLRVKPIQAPLDEDNPFADLQQPPVELDDEDDYTAHTDDEPDFDEPQYSAVLAIQLGAQEQLRRLPRARLM